MPSVCYNAAPGQRQPRERPEDGPPERVLHLSLTTDGPTQVAQEAALRRFGQDRKAYRRLNWLEHVVKYGTGVMEACLLRDVQQHRPTLIWMQVQAPDMVTPALLQRVRRLCPDNTMIVEWTGDIVDYDRKEGMSEHLQKWLAALCHDGLVDIFTSSDMVYPAEMAAQGQCPATGFVQCGYCKEQFVAHPQSPDPAGDPAGNLSIPEISAVFTAHRYPKMEAEDREELARAVGQALPTRLHIFGSNWEAIPGVVLHTPVTFEEANYLYARAHVSISTSCTDRMRRYTSGRLQHILGSGGCCAIHSFPDMEGLGLQDQKNCLVWSTPVDLVQLLGTWLSSERDAERQAIREAAVGLAQSSMTWDAAIEEMTFMLRRERQRRGISV